MMTRAALGAMILASVCVLLVNGHDKSVGPWVLMRPPVGIDGPRTLDPLFDWDLVNAFDSAEECLDELIRLRVIAYDGGLDAEASDRAAWTIAATVAEAARCAPTEFVFGEEGRRPAGHATDEFEELSPSEA